jgi:hypothetical protein
MTSANTTPTGPERAARWLCVTVSFLVFLAATVLLQWHGVAPRFLVYELAGHQLRTTGSGTTNPCNCSRPTQAALSW